MVANHNHRPHVSVPLCIIICTIVAKHMPSYTCHRRSHYYRPTPTTSSKRRYGVPRVVAACKARTTTCTCVGFKPREDQEQAIRRTARTTNKSATNGNKQTTIYNKQQQIARLYGREPFRERRFDALTSRVASANCSTTSMTWPLVMGFARKEVMPASLH